MSLSDLISKTRLTGFTAADESAILASLNVIYTGSPIARSMIDQWLATVDNVIDISFRSGVFDAEPSTGRISIDPAYIADLNYVNEIGITYAHTLTGALVHELSHALTGRLDDKALAPNSTDYQGDNVRFVNTIWKELGFETQVSYLAQNSSAIHRVGSDFTDRERIDAAASGDRNRNSSSLGDSRDLLIGGPSDNILESGPGNDFLFGAGGNDTLNGGAGIDVAVYFGEVLDYDVRYQKDGSWSVRNVRGLATDGTDNLRNIEFIQFDGGIRYELKKKALTYQTDFALVIDTTGSMGSSIDSVKANATRLIDAVFANGAADGRIGVVSFKDTTGGEPSTVILPFTDQDDFSVRQAAARAAINSMTVSGGGDTPETAFDGLRIALNGSLGEWRAGASTLRIALFTDAPAKDGALAAEVLSLARSIGATVTSSSSQAGRMGSVDVFALAKDTGGAASSGLDDRAADLRGVFTPANDPITPDRSVTTVEIYTIFTGGTGNSVDNLRQIAADTGGSFTEASTNEQLVNALIAIVRQPPVNDGTNRSYFGTVTFDVGSSGAKLAALYDAIFDRRPDLLGIQDWAEAVENGRSFAQVAEQFLNSVEYTQTYGALSGLSDTQFITKLYESALHRTPDAIGLKYWQDGIRDGFKRADVALDFALSKENINGLRAFASEGIFVPNTEASAVARFYHGTLGRAPDGVGLMRWTDTLEFTNDLRFIANGFLNSQEFRNVAGSLSNTQLIERLYDGALGRTASRTEIDSWLGKIGSGASRADVAVGITQSDEARMHLAKDIELGWVLM